MKLKVLLSILNEYNDIKILRADCHKDNIDNYNPVMYHEIYYGKVCDIPDYLMEYYLVKDIMGNPLSTEIDNTNYPYFTLIVAKDTPPAANSIN